MTSNGRDIETSKILRENNFFACKIIADDLLAFEASRNV